MNKLAWLFLIPVLLFSACKKDEEDIPEPKYPLFLVIVSSDLYHSISGDLATYVDGTARGDSTAKVIKWTGTSAPQLRDTIEKYYSDYSILGALLIGDLPYVRYEMDNWDKHEEFATDLYYATPGTQWYDDDSDGIYDRNSGVMVRYFISRLIGTSTEISQYFSKAEQYRNGNSNSIPKKAWLYIDNDWAAMYASEQFHMNSIYSVVDVLKDTTQTTRQAYSNYLSGSGAEYIMQLIHASYETLYFSHNGSYETMSLSEMISMNPKARFYNLFNCSGCNFEHENLGMAYCTKTTYGLCVMGTTKTGGNYYPQSFNDALADGKSWGEAWVTWWNTGASSIDWKWKMGLVIFGDPMLQVSRTATTSPAKNNALPVSPDKTMYSKNFQIRNGNK